MQQLSTFSARHRFETLKKVKCSLNVLLLMLLWVLMLHKMCNAAIGNFTAHYYIIVLTVLVLVCLFIC